MEFTHLTGNAASESILKKVAVERASTVIMTLGSDSDIIFSILVTRKLNPNSVILAMANEVHSIDKMYKAGADYVASLSIIAGQILGRIALLPHDKASSEIDPKTVIKEDMTLAVLGNVEQIKEFREKFVR